MEIIKKVVIVDDDIDIINVVKSVLTAKGYRVFSANSKPEGIELIRKENPDLIILQNVWTSSHLG